MSPVAGTGRRRALVFIDYDMLIRHFVLSGAFAEVERRYDVTWVFHHDTTSEKQGVYTDVAALGLRRWTRVEVPRARMGSWDPLYSITTLHRQRGTPNFTPRKEIMAVARSPWRVNLYHLLALPGIFPLVRARLTRQMGVWEPLLDFVRAERPDVIFHPSILAGYFINELLQIAPRLGVPLVVMMNSWDNPSVKAMNTGMPDRLVVWGPQTAQHAVEYLGMPPERVVQFGAAQFQLYREAPRESPAELRRLFGLPEGRPVILYGGGSKSIPESRHLELLDDAIAAGRIPPCHVIYRPHPWRGGLAPGETSFFDLSLRHVTIDPHMEDYYRRAAKAELRGFDLADYEVTRKLLHVVDAVISPLSTILLESVILAKPVLMFFPERGRGDVGGRVGDIGLRLAHFRDFWGVPGVDLCDDDQALPQACQQLLAASRDETVRRGLREHAAKFVVVDGPTYGQRLAALADELTAGRGGAA